MYNFKKYKKTMNKRGNLAFHDLKDEEGALTRGRK
jgi:hypothetical protein